MFPSFWRALTVSWQFFWLKKHAHVSFPAFSECGQQYWCTQFSAFWQHVPCVPAAEMRCTGTPRNGWGRIRGAGRKYTPLCASQKETQTGSTLFCLRFLLLRKRSHSCYTAALSVRSWQQIDPTFLWIQCWNNFRKKGVRVTQICFEAENKMLSTNISWTTHFYALSQNFC